MILIVDKTITDRAAALRNTLYSLGCPCAVSAPLEMKKHTPFRLIITYIDALDDVRHQPFDGTHAIVLGDGFVNSALNASHADDEMSAIVRAHALLMAEMGVTAERTTSFGVVFPPLFVAQDFIEVYGNMVRLTPTESVILKLLIGASCEDSPVTADMIDKYCSPSMKRGRSNTAAVHVSRINSKTGPFFSSPLIRFKNGGYYSVVNSYSTNGI